MEKRNNIYLLTAVSVLILYLLPYILQWDNSFITIHDNLDSDVVWYKSIAESGHLFSISNQVKLENIMNGISRNSLPSGYTIVALLFFFFAPFTAYFLNFCVTHIIAFIGMYVLLKTFVFPKKEDSFLYTGISLAFALLPFYGTHPGIAISGIPLLVWCFIHLKQNTGTWYHYVIILFFSFYSSLIYTGIFILFFLFIYIGFYWYRYLQLLRQFTVGLIVLTTGLLLSELQVISQIVYSDFIPHRIEFVSHGLSICGTLTESFKLFCFGQYHAPSAHWIIAILCLLYVIHTVYRKTISEIPKYILYITIIIIGISLFYGIWSSSFFIALQQKFSIIKIVQWHRFYWLLPVFWYVLFALIIRSILEHSNKFRKLLNIVVILQILIVLATNKEVIANYYNMIRPVLPEISITLPNPLRPTFSQYYDEKLFAEIRDSIGNPQQNYRIVSLGFNSDIAVYNGFYCLDSYQRNYSLDYKYQFKKIIEKEISKDSVLYNYFQNWGSRCYIFSHEIGTNYKVPKDSKIILHDFDFNADACKQMGGTYLFSAVEIEPKEDSKLRLFGAFQTKSSYWKIWVYSVE